MSRFDNCVICDIETLGIPDNMGYDLIVPNFAIVKVPMKLDISNIKYLYVLQSISLQKEYNLTYDPSNEFWEGICKDNFPLAYTAMDEANEIDNSVFVTNSNKTKTEYNPSVLNDFVEDGLFFGNGCHFDYSILQNNHRILYKEPMNINFRKPQNLRTLRLLLSTDEDNVMVNVVNEIINDSNVRDTMENWELHNPLYDATKEALYVRYILNKFPFLENN